MATLSERLKLMQKHFNIGSYGTMAHILNVSTSRVTSLMNNKVKELTVFELNNIMKNFHNINTDWVLLGEGNMLLDTQDIKSIPTTNTLDNINDTVSINFYPDIYAAAGYGTINEDQQPKLMPLSKSFLQEFFNIRKYDKLDIIKVIGDSMEPFIHNGEYVLVERDCQAQNGETVIASIEGQIYVKRFHADPFKKWIKLVSENEIYGDISLDTPEYIQALSIIGIVRAKIRPF